MKTSEHIVTAAVFCLILTACVTTTSGRTTPPANTADAAELNYELGARYLRNGRYELARDRLKLSLELDPKRAIAWSNLALTYEHLGILRLAEESHKQAVRAEPRNFDVRDAYATYLCRQNRFDDAGKHFERAIRAPDNDNAEFTLTNAGVCMAQRPDYSKAEAFFRQALERRSNHPEALLQLSLLKHKTGDNLIARAFLQRYLGVVDATPGVLFLGVQIEEELGDERARASYVNQLLRNFPNSAEARRVLEHD